jgi:GntR family transcriptional regulator
MIISLDAADPRPIYVQIVDEVRRGIVLGTVVANAPLPSVRHLASELRVNPNTVAQAYRELERLGLVFVRRGQGTFVSPDVESTIDAQREQLTEGLARRTSNDAYRNGLTIEELITALRRIEMSNPTEGETE